MTFLVYLVYINHKNIFKPKVSQMQMYTLFQLNNT